MAKRGDILAVYLAEIARTPLLSAEQERALGQRARSGDPIAREHLIRANLRLVVAIARAYTGRGLPIEDLVGEGNRGLCLAADRYDPERGRFATFARWWIRQTIGRALTLERRAPLGVGVGPGGGDEWTDPEAPEAPPDVAAAEGEELALRLDWLPGALRRLPDRHADLLTARFGLDGGGGLIYRECGARLGYSRSGAAFAEGLALDRLARMWQGRHSSLREGDPGHVFASVRWPVTGDKGA